MKRIMGEARKVPVTVDAGGDAIFPYFNPVLYERIPLLEPQQGDIIQVTYPRSGTHWVQQIIQLILNKGECERNYMDFMIRSPFIEAMELGATKAPRLLRTHSSMARLQFSKKAKYVYVARNPWDCCVSCFHFVREIPECQFEDGTFDDFVDSFLEGKFGFGEYFSHVLYGYGSRTEPNVFFVTYEELHKDKADVALRLAYFLGEDHGKMLEANQDVFRKVMEKSTAVYMRKLMTTTPEGMSNIIAKSFGLVPSSSATNRVKSEDRREVNILRKGEVGEWKQYFSKRSIEKMKAAIEVRTEGSDVMTLWKCHDASLELSS
ncbi:unnamed protein product [Ixodes pacificus]